MIDQIGNLFGPCVLKMFDDAETLIMDSKCLISEIGKKPLDLNDIQGQYTGLIKIRFDKILPMVEFYNSLDRSTFYDGKNFLTCT